MALAEPKDDCFVIVLLVSGEGTGAVGGGLLGDVYCFCIFSFENDLNDWRDFSSLSSSFSAFTTWSRSLTLDWVELDDSWDAVVSRRLLGGLRKAFPMERLPEESDAFRPRECCCSTFEGCSTPGGGGSTKVRVEGAGEWVWLEEKETDEERNCGFSTINDCAPLRLPSSVGGGVTTFG